MVDCARQRNGRCNGNAWQVERCGEERWKQRGEIFDRLLNAVVIWEHRQEGERETSDEKVAAQIDRPAASLLLTRDSTTMPLLAPVEQRAEIQQVMETDWGRLFLSNRRPIAGYNAC